MVEHWRHPACEGTRSSRDWIRSAALLVMLWGLSGCLLASGERETTDATGSGGTHRYSFLSAEGMTERSIETTSKNALLNVVVVVGLAQGELQLDILNPQGGIAMTVVARPGEDRSQVGTAPTDDAGRLRYRLTTRNAREGTINVLYQR